VDPEKIGRLIKNIREKNKLTQRQFAEKYNVSFQAVSKWENGKNLPDIALLKQICEDNKISLEDVLNGEKKKKSSKSLILVLGIVGLLLIVTGILIVVGYSKNTNNIKFKTITSSCATFKITGLAAYNKSQSTLLISKIEFCGEEDETVFKELSYSLYDANGDDKILISKGLEDTNKTIKEYVESLRIEVADYAELCYSEDVSDLLLEINVVNEEDVSVSYKIPLTLEDDC